MNADAYMFLVKSQMRSVKKKVNMSILHLKTITATEGAIKVQLIFFVTFSNSVVNI